MSKKKYYSLNRINKKNTTYNVIYGERSNGKTYSCLLQALKQWNKDRSELAIVRRWKEDITGRRASQMFSAINENGEVEKITNGKYAGITYYARKFYMCNYDEKGKAVYNDNDVLAHTFALSETEHDKSISFPKVKMIVFDEFLTKGAYLVDEFILFMNTLSTIIRDRKDVKIYMLGNTVNKYNPYFNEMGLTNAIKMKQGTIDIYQYGNTDLTVAVEYCSTNKDKKENNFYFAFDNPKLEMITGGSWELDIYPHLPIKYKPKDIQFIYFIEFMDNVYQCEVIYKEEMMFTFIHEKTTPIKNEDDDLIYSFDNQPKLNYNINILKPITKLQERIVWFFTHNRVYYQNNVVGDTINNYIKQCKGVANVNRI